MLIYKTNFGTVINFQSQIQFQIQTYKAARTKPCEATIFSVFATIGEILLPVIFIFLLKIKQSNYTIEKVPFVFSN